ncbi:peptidase domain-containing ABC transporter [Piscinibacter sp.]|uniref:peptidase domain-containing ABC transporter n=1 Tax=Piscinibacter sp. TaxID=1903157 RepID=UPI002CD20892|nr:peptidase domain-containing ABC transporter [Albitalea sp.]HUG26584.1 peptidase domain-containing ABC transporter [Albitalea sp.]
MKLERPLLSRFWRGRELPVVLQTEAAECGIACMAMVASYWGLCIDLAGMRRRFSVSIKGSSLKGLITMAQALGLQTRPLKADLEQLGDLRLPCVLHWDLTHFVVLKALRATHAVVHDPGFGERRLSLAELSRHFTGVALELTPGSSFRAGEARQRYTLLSLMGRVVGLRHGLTQLLVLAGALQVFALVAPFFLQWIVDEALVAADRDLVTVLALGFLLLAALQAAIGAVRSWVTTVLATHLNFQWLGNAFAHLMKLPIDYFEKRHLGDILSRFGSIQSIQHSLTTQFVEGIVDGVLVLAALAVMLTYSARLAGVAVVSVALYGALRAALLRRMREAAAEMLVHGARQQTHFLESARGVQTIRLFNRAQERRGGWMNMLADQFNAELCIARLSISAQGAQALLFGAERVIVVWLAALAVLDGGFSVGMLFAFLAYKEQFSQRTASLIDKLCELRMLRLHADRVADIVLSEPETDTQDIEIDPQRVAPSIQVRGLSFRYGDGEPWVIEGLDLDVPAGQCLAITGASGCGKTTLVKLLLGLLTPSEGEIRIGGIRLDRLGLANYRQLLGTVMQEDKLFAGSIADNISFFDAAPDGDRIEACARAAAIHDEIAAMAMGYGTLVGDIGSALSGGQRQRVLLARALYREPRILVLDEATSHLDSGNEQLVNAAIRQIALTRIIVAHRCETIAMAQRVVMLDRGRIVRDLSAEAAPANQDQRG